VAMPWDSPKRLTNAKVKRTIRTVASRKIGTHLHMYEHMYCIHTSMSTWFDKTSKKQKLLKPKRMLNHG